ncbi:MAG: hypothetical protein ACRC5T_10840 [Cetobacterium sp.]
MSKNSLEGLISDLDVLGKNFDRVIQSRCDDIIAMVFLAIGKATAYDTGVSRDLVKEILKKLGRGDLEKALNHFVWEFWKEVDARKKDKPSTVVLKENGKYEIQIHDYGFTQQDEGYVSTIHPRKSSRVIPRQVDYGIDLLETGSDKKIEEAFYRLETLIYKALDGVI